MKIIKLMFIVAMVPPLALASCCQSKKTISAKEALPTRNTQDPKLQNNPPKTELLDSAHL